MNHILNTFPLIYLFGSPYLPPSLFHSPTHFPSFLLIPFTPNLTLSVGSSGKDYWRKIKRCGVGRWWDGVFVLRNLQRGEGSSCGSKYSKVLCCFFTICLLSCRSTQGAGLCLCWPLFNFFLLSGLRICRFKVVVQTVVGQMKDQGIRVASRCLWDTSTDNYASCQYKNQELFCNVMIFCMYTD